MKLRDEEYELIFAFLNSAQEFMLDDANDELIIRCGNLKQNALTLNHGVIGAFNFPNVDFNFKFEDYEVMSRNMIYFYKKDGYVLKVFGDSSVARSLENLRNY